MDLDRDISRSFPRALQLRFGALALATLIVCGYAHVALAQGGQTEVSKTTPSSPPAVAAPTPPATPAVKPSPSPGGSGAQWQTNMAKPATQAPAEPVVESDLEIVGKVNDYFNKVTDLQGNFIQTDPDNRQKQGKFYMQRPGKVRFEYDASSLKIISDGRTLVLEDREANTSERYPLESTPFRILLSDTVDLAKDANILGVEQGPDTIIVTVEDKKSDGSGRIRLFFNKADMSLKQWIITDAQGLDTRIEVANLEQNKHVSADLFVFSAMVGYGFQNAN